MSGDATASPGPDHLHETINRIAREILDNPYATSAEISPSGELYRAIERYHHRARAESFETERQTSTHEHAQMSSDQDHIASEEDRHRRRTNLRRRLQRDASENSPLFVLPPQPPVAPLSAREGAAARMNRTSARRGSSGVRPVGVTTARRGRGLVADFRHPANQAAISEMASSSLAEIQQTGRQLEVATSNLRALLDDPVPGLSSPALTPEDYSGESEYNHRAKRRRLDSETVDGGFASFSYGKYGQVEPGKLKMEIVSCDGGIFQQSGGDYSAQNVLKNDTTVYCTKSNRCNLVLRHQGSTVFSLKELVIKAPHSGYTAPVQEGMVFISMTSDDLLTRTTQYQIQYSPARARCSRSPLSSELPPIRSVRHNDDGTMTMAQARTRRLYDIGQMDDDCDFRTAQIPSDFIVNAPPFQVTTECSESEGEEENHASHARRIDRLLGIQLEEPESSGDESPTAWGEFQSNDRPPRLRRRETASNITLAEAVEASQIATQEAVRAVGGELMAPHARFFIERDKSKCTVRFDPPVSGRFILLKMWSPHHSPTGNIDIQSVVAKGFAGPRYFPAVELC